MRFSERPSPQLRRRNLRFAPYKRSNGALSFSDMLRNSARQKPGSFFGKTRFLLFDLHLSFLCPVG